MTLQTHPAVFRSIINKTDLWIYTLEKTMNSSLMKFQVWMRKALQEVKLNLMADSVN